MIKDCVDSGLFESAFLVFKAMRRKGVSCDGYTFPALNKLVVLLQSDRIFSETIHSLAMRMGFDSDVYFCNTMIEAYVKVDCFRNASKLFDEMPYRDLVSWTSMISGYACEGNVGGATTLFNVMRKQIEPNEVTMIVVLQACDSVVAGRQLHGYAVKNGFLMDRSLRNAILRMYADFGSVDDSETLFEESSIVRDVISWNTMMFLYSSGGKTAAMLDCFDRMRSELEPRIETLTLFVSGLEDRENPREVLQIHCLVLKSGFSDDLLSSSMLNLYAKSGDLSTSIELFTEVSHFKNIMSLIVACTNLGSLRFGKTVHGYIVRNSLVGSNEDSQSLETSVLNMYIRCGSISSARICFDRMRVKDLITWTSMIEGCGTYGLGSQAFELFHQMRNEGIIPNSVTLLSLISACSHSGLLHEGCEILNSMKPVFGIEPDLGHYTCVVDLLGRFGKLKEALSVILKLVISPDSKIWAALLSAARLHEKRKIGRFCVEKVLELENDNAGYYTLFSNVEAVAERWDEAEEVRNAMKDRSLMKYPGWSCVEVKGNFHGFVSGDRTHPQIDEINRMTETLSRMHWGVPEF